MILYFLLDVISLSVTNFANTIPNKTWNGTKLQKYCFFVLFQVGLESCLQNRSLIKKTDVLMIKVQVDSLNNDTYEYSS